MIVEIDIKHKLGENNFDFQCKIDSEITGIYGPSGAGKTTLLNIISGLIIPEEGFIQINGNRVFDSKNGINLQEKKRNIGYVFQDGRLFPHLNVQKNLCYSKPYIKNKNVVATFDDVVNLLDLNTLLNKKPRELSGGEKQRVAIGRALLTQPSIILLDEPFANLDRYLRKQIISYLIKINQKFSIPLLIVSHIIGDILRMTNKMLVVNNGQIVANDDIFSLMTKNQVPEIIKPRRYLNIYDAILEQYIESEKLYVFKETKSKQTQFITSSKIAKHLNKDTKIRMAIRPDDIALSKNAISLISIQNQIKGFVKQVIETDKSTFCIVDCGIELVVEITKAALQYLNMKENDEVYCLIKAKAIEIIHVFE
jgi:molybdate transport system ATP-binding protein